MLRWMNSHLHLFPAEFRAVVALAALLALTTPNVIAQGQTLGPNSNPAPGSPTPNPPPVPVNPAATPAKPPPARPAQPVVPLPPGRAPVAPPLQSPAPAPAPGPQPVQPPAAAAPAYVPTPPASGATPAPAPVPPPSAAGVLGQPQPAPRPPRAADATVPAAPAGDPSQPGTVAPTAELPAEYEETAKRRCAAGEFCFGPVLTGGVLNVFGIGLQARTDYLGFAFDYQFIGLGYKSVDGTLSLITIEGRAYPFGDAFFLSAGFAWQNVALQSIVHATVNGVVLDIDARGNVNIPVFKLGLGFGGRDGFVFGIDLGIGFRLSAADVKLETDLKQFPGVDTTQIPEFVKAEAEFRQAANKWVEWLPFTLQLNLLRLSYLF